MPAFTSNLKIIAQLYSFTTNKSGETISINQLTSLQEAQEVNSAIFLII